MRVLLTKKLAGLAEEREKLLKAYYANAIPLDLLKKDQDRITESEQEAGPSWRPPRPTSPAGRRC